MPVNQQLLTQIRAALSAFSSLNVTAANKPWDLYEAYTFALVLQGARRLGATIRFENILGQPTTNIVFRTSPGTIHRPRAPRSLVLYTHAVLHFPRRQELEVHQGIYVSGRSGLPHECDVAVIDRAEGIACRNDPAHPRCHKMVLAAECKFYSSLGIGLARGFIGLTSDLASEDRFFVTNTAHENLERLLTHHARGWSHNTIPAHPFEINRIRARFETALKKYLARH